MAECADVLRFGTDGWRGIIAQDYTFANVRRMAAGAARFFRSQKPSQKPIVLVGYDRRFMSLDFACAARDVLQSEGCQVLISSSDLPTPALSACVVAHPADWGVMITASHNPFQYNGFKVKDALGRSASSEVTQAIELFIPDSVPIPREADRAENTFQYKVSYDQYLWRRLGRKTLLSSKARFATDSLFGAGSGVVDDLLRSSRLQIRSLHTAHDPLFGDLHPEPIEDYLAALKHEVKKSHALVGLAFDGDADRLGIVDDRGVYLTPHQVFPLLTLYGIEHKGWKGKIVQSVSMGALGERIAQAHGFPFEEVPVGFKHIAERMVQGGVLAGGEESGGYAFAGGLPERDGILNGLLFLEMLLVAGKKPSQLLQRMQRRFGAVCFHRNDMGLERTILDKAGFVERVQRKLPKRLIDQSIKEVRAQDGLKIILSKGAWVLLRPSGTEPLLRTYAESPNSKQTQSLLAWAGSAAREALS